MKAATQKDVTITAPITQTITGTSPLCVGGTATWTSTTGGGTWTSGTPATATVGETTGLVTGIAGGTSLITYSVTVDGCVYTPTKEVTVNPLPAANAITGTFTQCAGTSGVAYAVTTDNTGTGNTYAWSYSGGTGATFVQACLVRGA